MRALSFVCAFLLGIGGTTCHPWESGTWRAPNPCADEAPEPPVHYLCHFRRCLEMIDANDYRDLEALYDLAAASDRRTTVTEITVGEWIPREPVQIDMGYPTYQVDFPIAWNVDAYGDRTWQHKFHSLMWLSAFFDQADAGNPDALRTAMRVADDWIGANAFYPGTNTRYQWGDHTSTIRLRILAALRERYLASDFRDPAFYERLLASIAAHIYFLASDAFYIEQTNHGIMSDLELLGQPARLPGFRDTDEIFEWANQRIALQFAYAFSADGVTKEHSSCYHALVVALLHTYRNLLRDRGDPDTSRWSALLDNTSRFATQVVQPTGGFPAIGDCHEGEEVLASSAYLEENPEVSYAISGGTQGTAPVETMAVFDAGGWAVFRSSWDDPVREAIYAVVQSDFHSMVHYHADDTSFVLEGYGASLVVDPGFHSYNYEALDRFARSALAHNVLIVDGQDFNQDPAHMETSGITRWLAGPSGSWRGIVELTHKQYAKAGVTLYRQFAQLDERSFLVADSVTSSENHVYTQLYHLAPGSHLVSLGAGVYRFEWPTHNAILWIRNPSASFSVLEGEEDPHQGWVFPALLTAEPAQVLALEVGPTGDVEMATLLAATLADDVEPDWAALLARADQATSALAAVSRDSLPRP